MLNPLASNSQKMTHRYQGYIRGVAGSDLKSIHLTFKGLPTFLEGQIRPKNGVYYTVHEDLI
jgi:hypothetical protein